MKTFSIVSLLTILSIASAAEAATPFAFKNYEAHYTLRYDGIPFGKSTTTFTTDVQHHYELCIANKTTLPFIKGSTRECSTGFLSAQTVKPLHYDYNYQRGNTHQHIRIDFDWKNLQATITTKNSTWHSWIPVGTQDKLSYQLLLRHGLSQGQTSFAFPIADGGKLKTYEFTVVDEHNNLIKLDRKPIPSKENVSIWFRTDLNYIVSEVRQNKNIADIGTAELTSYTWTPHV